MAGFSIIIVLLLLYFLVLVVEAARIILTVVFIAALTVYFSIGLFLLCFSLYQRHKNKRKAKKDFTTTFLLVTGATIMTLCVISAIVSLNLAILKY